MQKWRISKIDLAVVCFICLWALWSVISPAFESAKVPPETCADSPVILDIAGVYIAESRAVKRPSITTKKGNHLYLPNPHRPEGYDCNTHYLSVKKLWYGYKSGNYAFLAPTQGLSELMKRRERRAAELQKNARGTKLSESIEFLDDNIFDTFVVKPSAAGNATRLVFQCSGKLKKRGNGSIYCNAYYQPVSGVIVEVLVPHLQKVPDFLHFEEVAREDLNKKIQAAQDLIKQHPEYTGPSKATK